jgi:hypothetical protein
MSLLIAIIGPGIMPIPPNSWGAVEVLIWNYAQELRALGHIVEIINTPHRQEILNQIRALEPDFVHIQYDDFADLATELSKIAHVVAITSHFGYLEQPTKWHSYNDVFQRCINHKSKNIFHFALSEGIAKVYRQHGIKNVYITPNGADSKMFHISKEPLFPNRSLCLGKIEHRKQQHLIQHNETIWFAGNKCGTEFDYSNPRYLGEWTKDVLYENLTNYANLVLLSEGEADPLVVKEALVAGLGIVITSCAAANLDTRQCFISIITKEELQNNQVVDKIISENRQTSIIHREEILEYSKRFHWDFLVPKYSELVCKLVNKHPICGGITIVSCYFKIPNKRNHEWYKKYVENFLTHVNQECIFWTTEDVKQEFKTIANPNVSFMVVDEIPNSKDFNMEFWQQQVDKDIERYHTPELAQIWYLKRFFVLESAKQKQRDPLHKYIWCDSGCVRSQIGIESLWNFGARYQLQDHKIHLQTLPPQLHEQVYDNFTYYVYPSIYIGCAIMFGSQEAWFVYNAMYNEVLKSYNNVGISATSDQYVTMSCLKKANSLFVLHKSEVIDDPWFQFLETI